MKYFERLALSTTIDMVWGFSLISFDDKPLLAKSPNLCILYEPQINSRLFHFSINIIYE